MLQLSQIKYLKITGSKEVPSAVEDIASCVNKLEVLALIRCNIGEEFVQKLCEAISTLDTPVRNLRNNQPVIYNC